MLIFKRKRTMVWVVAASGLMGFTGVAPVQAGDVSVGVHVGSSHHGRHVSRGRPRHHDRRHHRNQGSRRHSRIGFHFDLGHAPYHHRYRTGHYVVHSYRVKVSDGYYRDVRVEPVYEWRCDAYGQRYRVRVADGYWRKVWRPPVYETRYKKIWVGGHDVRY